LTPTNVRQADKYLAIKTTGTQQGFIKHVGTVGGGDNNDAIIAFKTVHFYQQLVERLLALIMATAMAAATMTTYGIDLIDKNNARRLFLRLFKHIADAGRTHTDKHLHEIGA